MDDDILSFFILLFCNRILYSPDCPTIHDVARDVLELLPVY